MFNPLHTKSLICSVGHTRQYWMHNKNSVTKLETKGAIYTTKKKKGLKEGGRQEALDILSAPLD